VTRLIKVTRLNGEQLYINALLIESVEQKPDTIVTLTTGKKMIVRETAQEVSDLVKAYMQSIGSIRLAVKAQTAEGPEEF
jgi:flagellar protein FlbD